MQGRVCGENTKNFFLVGLEVDCYCYWQNLGFVVEAVPAAAIVAAASRSRSAMYEWRVISVPTL